MRNNDLFLQSTEIFDASYLREVTGGDLDLMRSLVLLFAEETAQRLVQFNTAVQQNKHQDALREAHTLKGSCSQLGEGSLHQAAIALEIAVRTQKKADIARCFEDFQRAFQRLQALLRTP